MTGRTVLYSIFLFFIFSHCFSQVAKNTAKRDSIASEIVNLTIKQEYNNALLLAKEYRKADSLSPLAPLMLAAVKLSQKQDLLINHEKSFIEENLELAEGLSLQLLAQDENGLFSNYYTALTYSYIGYYKYISDDFLASLDYALIALQYYEKCLMIDKDFPDAKLVQGFVTYLKSMINSYLDWLPFVEDNREIALEIIGNNFRYSFLNRQLAGLSLIWIYIDNDRLEDANSIANELLVDYPNNRAILWAKLSVHVRMESEESIDIINKIEKSITDQNLWNDCLFIYVNHRKAIIYAEHGLKSEAIEICNKILNLINPEIKNCTEEYRIELVKELKNELLGL